MDTAVNMQGDISVQDDGTWSYTWSWVYAGGAPVSELHEEIVLTDPQGLLVAAKQEPAHEAVPGQTYLGGGSGDRPIRPGEILWSVRVIQRDAILGMTGGRFFAATSPQS